MLMQSQAKLQELQPEENTFERKLDGVQRSVKLLRLMIDLFQRRSNELKLDGRSDMKPAVLESV